MQNLKTRKLNRLKDYDCSTNGYYFVTVCSNDRKTIFGEYKNVVGALLACARIELSIIGEIIEKQWNDIPNEYDNIKLEHYVIMSNHIHGILFIHNDNIINKRAQASSAPTVSQIIRSFKSKSAMEYIKYLKSKQFEYFR